SRSRNGSGRRIVLAIRLRGGIRRAFFCVSLGMGAEELEQQCIVGFDPCLWKAMTAMVELDETRMCNLLSDGLAQLPCNEEIVHCRNQERRVLDTPQAFSGVISEQRIDAFRDALRPSKPTCSYNARLRKMNTSRNRASSRAQVAPRTRDATRSEGSAASTCAMGPPVECPTRCTRSRPM